MEELMKTIKETDDTQGKISNNSKLKEKEQEWIEKQIYWDKNSEEKEYIPFSHLSQNILLIAPIT